LNLIDYSKSDIKYQIINFPDGGGTFAGIASLLNEYNREKAIYVTHMINPKGIHTLSENYDRVIITNSYKNWENENLPNNITVCSVI
jgi:phosphoribosylpyrophosphate synthetase